MMAAPEDKNKRTKVNNFRFYNPLQVLHPEDGRLGSYFSDHKPRHEPTVPTPARRQRQHERSCRRS
jgi:hypothetical protein